MGSLKRFLRSNRERSVILLILAGVLMVVFLVRLNPAFLNFFFLPVILAGYQLGKRYAVLTAFFCVLAVAMYLLYAGLFDAARPAVTLDELINLTTWGGFLILTGGMIGALSEQRINRLRKVHDAYVALLGVVLKYLEVADETAPRSVRVSQRAGRIAAAAEGLERRDVENIKSAALLAEAGDLRSSLSLFDEASQFMSDPALASGSGLCSRDRVLLRTAAGLLEDVGPILAGYFRHYAGDLLTAAPPEPGALREIPLGSAILALADLCERLSTGGPQTAGGRRVSSIEDIPSLSGTIFPAEAVQALVISRARPF